MANWLARSMPDPSEQLRREKLQALFQPGNLLTDAATGEAYQVVWAEMCSAGLRAPGGELRVLDWLGPHGVQSQLADDWLLAP